jgi:hypothetical protein
MRVKGLRWLRCTEEKGYILLNQRELVKVMEPTLLQDLDVLIDFIGGPEPLIRFLDAAMTAKCARTRLALFGLLVSGAFRNRDLRKKSLAEIRNLALTQALWGASEARRQGAKPKNKP